MNIQHISSLASMMVAAGFEEGIGRRLLRHACFKPGHFILTERLAKGNDILTCTLMFEQKGDQYYCHYYDAALLRFAELPDTTIQSVSVRELDERMSTVDWNGSSQHTASFNWKDESTWQEELLIEQIVSDLVRLSVTEQGRQYADCLKIKYWQENVFAHVNLQAIRSKMEVSQRFYFFDGQGISIDEAYRFLLNRWLERKVHARKKAGESSEVAESGASDDKSLLQKKSKRKTHKVKR